MAAAAAVVIAGGALMRGGPGVPAKSAAAPAALPQHAAAAAPKDAAPLEVVVPEAQPGDQGDAPLEPMTLASDGRPGDAPLKASAVRRGPAEDRPAVQTAAVAKPVTPAFRPVPIDGALATEAGDNGRGFRLMRLARQTNAASSAFLAAAPTAPRNDAARPSAPPAAARAAQPRTRLGPSGHHAPSLTGQDGRESDQVVGGAEAAAKARDDVPVPFRVWDSDARQAVDEQGLDLSPQLEEVDKSVGGARQRFVPKVQLGKKVAIRYNVRNMQELKAPMRITLSIRDTTEHRVLVQTCIEVRAKQNYVYQTPWAPTPEWAAKYDKELEFSLYAGGGDGDKDFILKDVKLVTLHERSQAR